MTEKSLDEWIELAWIERAEERGYRDRIHCPRCGRITVMDGIPIGIHVELKEDEDDERFI